MFTNLKELTIPEGKVTKIEAGGQTIWEKKQTFTYVSLGDSIAAGHFIREEPHLTGNENWKWQYGEVNNDGKVNESTEIISGCYTDLIRKKLYEIHGRDNVRAVSYAYSGSENHHSSDAKKSLYSYLYHSPIEKDVTNANLVTVSIGANSLLAHAIEGLKSYAAYGTPALAELEATMDAGLAVLKGGVDTPGSYLSIFKRIAYLNTNPDARFVFTTVYHPYKYLWLDESTDQNDYVDGFFGPILTADVLNVEDEYPVIGELDLRKFIYEAPLVSGFSMKKLIQRVNDPYKNGSISLAQWIDGKIKDLNDSIFEALEKYKELDEENAKRFIIADTKSVFDSVPDVWIDRAYNYSDLVNVEFCHGLVVRDLNWGKYWENLDVRDIIEEALKGFASGNDFWDSLTKGFGKTFEAIGAQIIEHVIMPDMDPHPEEKGHVLLYHSFADALGWETLNKYTITYNLNGGTGSPTTQKVVSVDKNAYVMFETDKFSKAGSSLFAVDCNNTRYLVKDTLFRYIYGYVNSNATANVIWGYRVRYSKSLRMETAGSISEKYTNGSSGAMENYSLAFSQTQDGTYTEVSSGGIVNFNGTLLPMEPFAFRDPAGSVILPHGTWVKVWVKDSGSTKNFYGDDVSSDTYIKWNGTKIKTGSNIEHRFELTSGVNINFELYWNGLSFFGVAYDLDLEWQCHITTT
jgi:lysophospholipase L1-like esterase